MIKKCFKLSVILISLSILCVLNKTVSAKTNVVPKLVSTAPNGKFEIQMRRSKQEGFWLTEIFLKQLIPKGVIREIDLPDNVALTELLPPAIKFAWNKDARLIALQVQWQKSDELLVCDASKSPLRFQDLPDPNWNIVLSSGTKKIDYEANAWRFKINVDTFGFDSDTGLLVTFRVIEEDASTYLFTFKYQPSEGGIYSVHLLNRKKE